MGKLLKKAYCCLNTTGQQFRLYTTELYREVLEKPEGLSEKSRRRTLFVGLKERKLGMCKAKTQAMGNKKD